MFFEVVRLSPQGPRNALALRRAFKTQEGLWAYYVWGLFFLLFPLVLTVWSLNQGRLQADLNRLLVFSFVFEILAIIILIYAAKLSLQRSNALSDGRPVKGLVQKQSKRFVWYKFRYDYILELEWQAPDGKKQAQISHYSPKLHEQFPLGSALLGMYDIRTEALSFGLEMRRQILLLNSDVKMINTHKKNKH